MALKRIRLELARTPDHPEGSPRHGYEFVAPLDASGHMIATNWPKVKDACMVRRFWAGADDEHGRLIHRRDGKWAFSYAAGEDDDEPIFRFDKHVFRQGEYVSVTEHDGVTRPFKVIDVRAAVAGAA
jgi:hypothetical protein